MRRSAWTRDSSLAGAILLALAVTRNAAAQPTAPPAAQPPAPPAAEPPSPATPPPNQPPAQTPAPPPLQPGQIPPEAQPPPPASPYPYYYNYYNPVQPPPQGTPAPHAPVPEASTCCRFAVRFNPFDLLLRRLSFQGEVAIWGPFSIEVEPSWIWGSPTSQVDASGFAIKGVAGFYLTGKAPQGFFIKAIVEYERYEATVTNPDDKAFTQKGTVASPVLGALVGSSTVFGKRWGFNISGGIGVGFATAGPTTITAPGKGLITPYAVTFNKGAGVQLIGSLSAGIGF